MKRDPCFVTPTACKVGKHYVLFHYWVLSYAFVASVTSADQIHGCGGFVEASTSLIKSRKPLEEKLDYSDISVEIHTLDGLLKDKTQCAPNGYYFLPVYDKGSFLMKVKGQEGWSWDPDKVYVTVDHNGCNSNEDINFRFTGFTVSGRVAGAVGGQSCPRIDGGPANISVELRSTNGDILSSVLTSSLGTYVLKDVTPGRFKLHASHPDFHINIIGTTEIKVGFGNYVVDDIFLVTGYSIRGFVISQGDPVLGVYFYLHSEDITDVECPFSVSTSPRGRKALCHAISSADGMFEFKSIPCGLYELEPYYRGESTVFDVSPPFMSVSVEHHHLSLVQRFQVTGFSIGGRVIDAYGNGVEGVVIFVDGNERSITDTLGYYKLDQVAANRYTIKAVKEHYEFDNLRDFLVLPNASSIPDIKANRYDVCGTVWIDTPGYKAKVALTHGPDNVRPQIVHTDENGTFCLAVIEGEYRLSAMPTLPERDSGISFIPHYIDMAVKNPVLNVRFSQALFNIHGVIVCKESCSDFVTATLSESDGRNTEKKFHSSSGASRNKTFSFFGVLPGKYRIKVEYESSAEADWCWERDHVDVDVAAEDITNVFFVQQGYQMKAICSHDLIGRFVHPDGSSSAVKLSKGLQPLCVETPGVHTLHLTDNCVSFGNASMEINTADLSPIYLKAEKYVLRGRITIDTDAIIPSAVNSPPDEFTVDVVREGRIVSESVAGRVLHSGDPLARIVYEYHYWAAMGDELSFTPRDSRDEGVRKFLFFPAERNASVKHDGCQESIPSFSARPGLYIEGSVSPAITGVRVVVVSENGEPAFETHTGEDGLFVAGPLLDDRRFLVTASKDGYSVKPLGPHSFSCHKLSQISVRVRLPDGLLPPVLLSLSGDGGYRNNSLSLPGGSFLFDNLLPGSFYLRPLLKEYAFVPPARPVDLGSGDHAQLLFDAVRVAFSAFGVVSLLSGTPVGGIPVEARSESAAFYEETVTDSYGRYRLRGLLPGSSYSIRIANRLGPVAIERASPELLTVRTGSEDLSGLDFVVFERPLTTVLTCHVEVQGGRDLAEAHRSEIRVEIWSVVGGELESSFPLPRLDFFRVKGLSRGRHVVVLRSTSPSFHSAPLEFDFDQQAHLHVGPLTYTLLPRGHRKEAAPAPVLYPLVVGVSVISVFLILPRIRELFSWGAGREGRKPGPKRKTY